MFVKDIAKKMDEFLFQKKKNNCKMLPVPKRKGTKGNKRRK